MEMLCKCTVFALCINSPSFLVVVVVHWLYCNCQSVCVLCQRVDTTHGDALSLLLSHQAELRVKATIHLQTEFDVALHYHVFLFLCLSV